MLRRTYTNRSIAAAKLCVALVGMAAIPTWAIAQQSTAKPETKKPVESKPAIAIDLAVPVSADKSATEKELAALKAEMDSLNARLKQIQAEKAQQLADQKAALERARQDAKIAEDRIREVRQAEAKTKLDQAGRKAAKVEDQVREIKKDEQKVIDAVIKDRLNAIADHEGLKLQLGEFKVQAQQAIEKEKVAAEAAAKAAKSLTEWKLAQVAPAQAGATAPVKDNTRQILRSGSQGVKVIGADGKEIPGVVVIIDTQIEATAPAAKATTMTLTPGANGELKGTLFLDAGAGQPVAPAQAPKIVEGKPLTTATIKSVQGVPAAPAAPVKVEGVKIQVQPGAPAAPAAPAAPTKVEGFRIQLQPSPIPPAAPAAPAKPQAGMTWTFETANLHQAAPNTITLSRATYKLPKEQAATLANLLSGSKNIVMETKLDNDTLVVTTTPEAQKEIAGFVRLITGAPIKVNFSVPLPPNSTSHLLPALPPNSTSHLLPVLPALPTAQSGLAMPATSIVDFKVIDTKGNFTVVADEAPKANVQFYQIQQGKNGEMTIVGTAEKPKSEVKNIEIKAKEANGIVTLETVDVVGANPDAVQFKKGEKGETIVIGVADVGVASPAKKEGKKIEVKATEANGVITVETIDASGAKPKAIQIKKGEKGETILIGVGEGQGGSTGTIRLNNLSTVAPATPAEAPKKTAPAAPAEKSK